MIFLVGILNLLAAVVVPPLSSLMARLYDPLLAYSLSVPILLFPLCILWFMPASASGSQP